MWQWITDHPGAAALVVTVLGLGWRFAAMHFTAIHRIDSVERQVKKHLADTEPLRSDIVRVIVDLRKLEHIVADMRKTHDDDKADLLLTAQSIEARLGKEIDGLREWRHTVANQLTESLRDIKREIVGELRKQAAKT